MRIFTGTRAASSARSGVSIAKRLAPSSIALSPKICDRRSVQRAARVDRGAMPGARRLGERHVVTGRAGVLGEVAAPPDGDRLVGIPVQQEDE